MLVLMIGVLGVGAVLELALQMVGWLWRLRRQLAIAIIPTVAFASGFMAFWSWNVCTALLAAVTIYRVVNLLRLVEGRMNELYLRRATRTTSYWLIGAQMLLLGAWLVARQYPLSASAVRIVLLCLQTVVAVLLFMATIRTLQKAKPLLSTKPLADRNAPTVSVLIPARNEDVQLEECLSTVLASNYPKLEVLVYDDCSQDKTAGIIRGFAHDGVRFIPGKEPATDTWLAKNTAYQRLAEEASGELLLFCGVDVRFAPDSIRALVTTLPTRHKTMLSILPFSERRSISLVQSMRYFWELALPRRTFSRPPVLSSCWLVAAEQLQKAGGFAAVSRSIVPEAHFARQAIQTDGYRFMYSMPRLGITTVKSTSEQRATAIRTHYPQLHRKPEMVLAVVLAELLLLLAPFILFFVGLGSAWGFVAEAALAVSCVLLLTAYQLLLSVAFPLASRFILSLFPVALLIDMALLHYSMWRYEFSEVVWKGRNVCIPVMRAIPHLPQLE